MPPFFSRPSSKAWTQLIVGVCCLAAAPLLVRLSEVGPISTAFYRLLIAQPVFLLMILPALRKDYVQHKSFRLGSKAHLWGALSGVMLALNLVLWNYSLSLISVANASLIDNLAPVFIALFAWAVLGEQPSKKLCIGMGLALFGATLLALGEKTGEGSGSVAALIEGHLIALIGAAFYAAYFLTLKEASKYASVSRVMFDSGIGGIITLVPLMFISGEQWLPATLMGWVVLFAMALLIHCLGQGLVGKGFANLPASQASLLLLLQPVASALLAWGFFAESLTALQILGAAAILWGLYMAKQKHAEPEETSEKASAKAHVVAKHT